MNVAKRASPRRSPLITIDRRLRDDVSPLRFAAPVAHVYNPLDYGWDAHAEYLRLGGIDAFIGDGTINPSAETALDLFYALNLRKFLWISGDYQRVANPAFNADRGPVNILGVRIHIEF